MNLRLKLLASMLCYVNFWLSASGETRGFLFENGNYSYKIVLGGDDLRSWFEAEEICRNREGGHLASITSEAENTFVNEKILLLGHSPEDVEELWLGAIDEQLALVDVYQWVDGEKFKYSSALWAPGEPKNELQEGYEVCVALKSNGERAEWIGADCYASKGYVCKIKGVPKRLVDHKRFGYEFDHGNYIYKFIFMQYDMLPWPEAEIYCRDVEAGHLARVRDLRVSKTIEKDLRKIRFYFGFSKMWIGASDLNNEGQFEWTHGGPFKFQRWVQGEPSGRRRGMEEDCVVVTADPDWAHWKDEYCLHHLPFICQTKVCHKRSDIGFAVDISTSVRINGFVKSREFIKKVLNRFPISKQGVHAGLIHFSSSSRLIFGFNEHYTLSDVEDALDRAKYTKGGTRTDMALKLARTGLFALPPDGSSRKNIPRFLVLTTDGISVDPSSTRREARALKKEGVHVIVVGVGNRANPKELREIASRPRDVIKVRSFAHMERIVENVRRAICED